jgi:ketosteroid isomerase-like protein
MRRAWIRRLAIAAASAAVLAGCGGSGGDDQGSATDAARAYVDAINSRDFDRVCGLLSDSYKARLKMGSDCPAFLEEQSSGLPPSKLALISVREQGDHATAHIRTHANENIAGGIADESALFVRDQDGDWRLTAVTGYSGK